VADLRCKVIFYFTDGKTYEYYHSNNAPQQALNRACEEYGNLDKVEKIDILREI
jgi:hypothetical protein